MDNVLITNKAWELIRELFTERQKKQMRDCKSGTIICPPGVMVDVDALPEELQKRLRMSLKRANAKLSTRDKR